jgi:hypothetical protein
MRFTVAFTILILGGRIAESQRPPFGDLSTLAPLQSACRALLGALSGPVLERLGGTLLLFSPQVDGGGDGGGGDGGDGGDGGAGDGSGGAGTSGDGSTGGDSGTGAGNSGDSDSDSDGPGADPGSVGAPGDQGDPGNTEDAPANDAEAPPDPPAVTDPTDPPAISTINAEPPSVPTNDPALGLRGPGSSGTGVIENGAAFDSVGVAPSTVSSGLLAAVDVGINAVIVSGARTPWEAVGRSSGVRNVIVTGGIIALGETALAIPAPSVTVGTAESPPEWLKFQPDLRYLNGSVFPPVVPNVIDIRTISNSEAVIENLSK